jgi:hypothetical protein
MSSTDKNASQLTGSTEYIGADAQRMFEKPSSFFGLPPALERSFIAMWLLFLYIPIHNALRSPQRSIPPEVAVFVAVGFASLYVYLTWTPRDNDRHSLRKKILLLGTMCVLAMGCTLLWGSDWLELFFFIGCGSGLLLPSAIAAWAVLATAATANWQTGFSRWIHSEPERK